MAEKAPGFEGHSYGHGQFCFYCGADAETEDDKPCDESLHQKPTVEDVARWDRRERAAQGLEVIAFEYANGIIETTDAVIAKVTEWASLHKSEGDSK